MGKLVNGVITSEKWSCSIYTLPKFFLTPSKMASFWGPHKTPASYRFIHPSIGGCLGILRATWICFFRWFLGRDWDLMGFTDFTAIVHHHRAAAFFFVFVAKNLYGFLRWCVETTTRLLGKKQTTGVQREWWMTRSVCCWELFLAGCFPIVFVVGIFFTYLETWSRWFPIWLVQGGSTASSTWDFLASKSHTNRWSPMNI